MNNRQKKKIHNQRNRKEMSKLYVLNIEEKKAIIYNLKFPFSYCFDAFAVVAAGASLV